MHLTHEEKEMLKGSQGPGVQLAMEILVELGDAFKAPCLIPVQSAHIVISNYKNSFDAGIEILERFASLGAKAAVPTTVDPAGFDLDRWQALSIPKGYAEKQWRICKAFQALEFIPCWTCTPYLCGLLPRREDHLAWTESSAVVFANSIVGARTNRETAGGDVASALTGRTPYHGLHLNENRWGQLLIDVQLKILTPQQYNILGYFMGLTSGTKIPALTGLEKTARLENYMAMGAASAASGGVALYHLVGVTPEAPTVEKTFGQNPIPQPIPFGIQEIKDTKARMCTAKPGKLDAVLVGCPHYTLAEIRDLARLLDGRRIKPHVKFWIYTYKSNILLAERLGYKEGIEKAGAEFIADTCMIVTHAELYGFKRIMTDSGKCAHYAPTEVQTEVAFGSIDECVGAALTGEWAGV
jgi:predicted aconitase